jgi:broad specificity phosphatase PhoE
MRQAAILASRLKDVLPFDRIVASDLARARQTAEIMSEGHQTPILTDEGFREMDFGQWEGLEIKEIRARWPDEIEEWFAGGRLHVVGGETQEQFFERVWVRFRHWADQPDYEKMAIVCHGGTCGTLFCGVLRRPPHELSKYMPRNTSISRVTVEGPGRYSIDELGDMMR